MYFFTVIALTILQRLYELKVARKNTQALLARGALEFGADHYWMMVALHVLFFVGMGLEAFMRGIHPPVLYWPILLMVYITAQLGRIWVMKTMNGRWTTRILVIAGEKLITHGPFRYMDHPNYTIVAVEILVLPLIFGLTYSAIAFSILNAALLVFVRLPEERRALAWTGKRGERCPTPS